MKNNVFWKSTKRRPVRTVFLTLLIGLVSFAFVSRFVEFVVVERETKRLAGYYRSIGFLEPFDEEDYYVYSGAELISKSPYLSFEDRRRTCSGVMDGVYSADIAGESSHYGESESIRPLYRSDAFFYGQLTNKVYNAEEKIFILSILVDKVEAAYPEHAKVGQNVILHIDASEQGKTLLTGMERGERYFVKTYCNLEDDWNFSANRSITLTMKPLNEQGLMFVPVEPDASVDFTSPALLGLEEEIEILRENQSTLSVNTTHDMSALPVMQTNSRLYALEDGRWITEDDDMHAKPVCVINRSFARMRGLSVGDTLQVKLRDMQSYHSSIVDGDEQWREYPTHDVTLEIVGIYSFLVAQRAQPLFQNMMIYIPDSVMPESFGGDLGDVFDAGYSFVLRSSKDQDAFIQKYRAPLEELGLNLYFVENNSEIFWASVTPLQQSSALSAGLLGGAMVVVLLLIVFLYLRQTRKDFAILRALGMPAKTAVYKWLFPALMWLPGILVGGMLAWSFASEKAMEALATIQRPDGVELVSSLSLSYLLGLYVAIFALLVLFLYIGAMHFARSSVFELIQGESAKAEGGRPKKIQPGEVAHASKINDDISPGSEMTKANRHESSKRAKPSKRFHPAASIRYIWHHIIRSPFKSILTVIVAMIFVLMFGFLQNAMHKNEAEIERLYLSTVIDAEIVRKDPNFSTNYSQGQLIRYPTVDYFIDNEYVQDLYLDAGSPIFLFNDPKEYSEDYDYSEEEMSDFHYYMFAFNQIETFLANTGVVIEYMEGWNEEIFSESEAFHVKGDLIPILLSNELMEKRQHALGDKVCLIVTIPSLGLVNVFDCIIVGELTQQGDLGVHSLDSDVITGEEVILWNIGFYDIFLPMPDFQFIDGEYLKYKTAKMTFDPARNKELPIFKEEMRKVVEGIDAGTQPLKFVVWDEELRLAIEPMEKNLSLVRVLYPVTILVSVLIATGLSVLLMFQKAKEAAVMRVLGSTKLHLRVVLCGEQWLLCIFGLLLGLFIQWILYINGISEFRFELLICAGLYFVASLLGSVISAVSVTNKKPLELIQVKE